MEIDKKTSYYVGKDKIKPPWGREGKATEGRLGECRVAMEKWVRERKIIGLERRKAKGCNLRSSPGMAEVGGSLLAEFLVAKMWKSFRIPVEHTGAHARAHAHTRAPTPVLIHTHKLNNRDKHEHEFLVI